MKSDYALQRLAKLDTAAVSDAMDRLRIVGQCLGIKPRDPSFRLVGRAFTVRYGAATKPAGSVGDYIDDVEPGEVVVLDNGGREDATVWGDILSWVAHTRGIAGTVIEGACRDVNVCRELGYPVFSRSSSMRTGKDRVQVEAYGGPVTLGGARVEPGDLLLGDADGVVVLPRALEQAILEAAEAVVAVEAQIRERVRAGQRLDAAREVLGYHALQTPAENAGETR